MDFCNVLDNQSINTGRGKSVVRKDNTDCVEPPAVLTNYYCLNGDILPIMKSKDEATRGAFHVGCCVRTLPQSSL